MKMFYKILPSILLLGLLCGSVVLEAQSGKLKRGRQMMENLAYHEAIELYNQVLEDSDVAEAKINLAEAYRKVNDPANAEFWYGQVVQLPEAQAIHKLYYGMMLQQNGKCDIAQKWYQQYTIAVPDDQRGVYLARACDYEEELMQKSAGIYEVTRTDFNSNLDDFSPAFYGDGLVFTSERDRGAAVRREFQWTGNPFLELYYVDASSSGDEGCTYVFGRPEKFSKDLNSKFHDAAVAFSKDEQQIYFTRNNLVDGKTGESDDGIIKLKVFYASSEGEGQWGDLQGLPFNSDEYNVAHPTLSTDGNTLYFASDMPGGYGGMDLYSSELESGRWGIPMNLGPTVNTEGHELFPQFDRSERLYFSSDGHIGLGGLDIYYVTDQGNGDWTMPENIGAPINSIADDFGIAFNENGTCGFFSSDRAGGAGNDDVYSFAKTALPVEVYVYDAKTEEPLEGATVNIGCLNETKVTGQNGKILFDMKPNEVCNFLATYEGYDPAEKEGSTLGLTLNDELLVEIPMIPTKAFELTGTTWDNLNQLALESVTVTLENDCGQEVQTFVTGLDGKFSFMLDDDCCYTIRGEREGYFTKSEEGICTRDKEDSEAFLITLDMDAYTTDPTTFDPTKAYENDYTYRDPSTGIWIDATTGLPADGEYPDGKTYEKGGLVGGSPETGYVSPNDLVDENGQVAVPFLVHVYYDFDESYIRDESEPALQSLIGLLNENADLIIEIGSHTDARGRDSYNNRLSQRRASAVVEYLVERGIPRNRLVPRGYGESVPVNGCANNIPCDEREHQMNRRTEFKVIGCLSCVQEATEVISQPKQDVRVDECASCPF